MDTELHGIFVDMELHGGLVTRKYTEVCWTRNGTEIWLSRAYTGFFFINFRWTRVIYTVTRVIDTATRDTVGANSHYQIKNLTD